jgi:hypothetical protein
MAYIDSNSKNREIGISRIKMCGKKVQRYRGVTLFTT